jgi:hypothetical protein
MKRKVTMVVLCSGLLGMTACTTQSPFPRSDPLREGAPLPSKPLPISAFAVRFTPAVSETYPPTKEVETRPYRVVLYLGSTPPQVRRDTKPSRPYITVGTLSFGENWYTGKNLDELTEKYVSEVGGDAVLTWSIYQTAAMMLPGAGQFTYAIYYLEVIRYTDR